VNIKDKLTDDLKTAMRSNDGIAKETIRSLKTAIKNKEIDVGHPLTEPESVAVLQKAAKQRRDAIEQYRDANRDDLVAQETAELAIIEAYLPKQLSDTELQDIIAATIKEVGATDMSHMGKLMGALMPKVKGQADGKKVNQLVRELLSGTSENA
jgi:uncharacterized protein YqeY